MNTRNPNITLLLILSTALAPLIWGSTYIVTTELLPAERPFIAAAVRTLPAGIALLLWVRIMPSATQWWRLCLLSALNIGAFQALLFIAAYRLPGGLAAVLGASQPLILLALLWGVQQQPPATHKLLAALTAILGMALLLLGPATTWDGLGVLAALGGAVCMACGVFLAKQWQQELPLLAFTGWQLTLGGLMLLPAALWIDPAIVQLSLSQGLSYLYLSLCGALLAYVLWFHGIALLPPVAVSALGLLSPLSAVALGWLFLGQSLDAVALCGLILVLLSIITLQCDGATLAKLTLTLKLKSKTPLPQTQITGDSLK